MKINWGTGLVIGMALFMGFIMFFVIQILADDEHDLVVENYYEKAMMYQDEMDAEKNGNDLEHNVYGKRTNEGWMLIFPEELDQTKITGTVSLYRPSNKNLDFEVPIHLSSSQLLIPDEKMIAGRWNTIVNWKYEGKDYLFKDKIVY